MLGNLQGWIISLILGGVLGGALGWSAKPRTIAPPSGDAAVSPALLPVTLPAAGALRPAAEPCDAGDSYRSALAEYEQNKMAYRAFRQHASLENLSGLPAIGAIVNAAHCSSAGIFRASPSTLIDYNIQHPSVEAFETLGNITIAAGLLHKVNRDFEQSRRYIDAGFALGDKLFSERLTFVEMGAGLGLMQSAASALQSLARDKGDAALADSAARFLKEAEESGARWINCYKIVGAVDESFAGPYTGDVFRIVQSSSADPMWRVEAIKHLGHYQYNAANKTTTREARRLLLKLSGDPNLDPVIRAAAGAAKELTFEQHRGTR